MDEKTLQQIDELAKSLADANITAEDELLEVVEKAGKESLKKAVESMSEEQKQTLTAVLAKGKHEGEAHKKHHKDLDKLLQEEEKEHKKDIDKDGKVAKKEMKKSEEEMEDNKQEESVEKAVSMDAEAHPQADAMSEKVMVGKVDQKEEQDEEDEKLVKPEAAKHNHQGDNTPEGFEGQVIKSESQNGEENKEESNLEKSEQEESSSEKEEESIEKSEEQKALEETIMLAKSIGVSKEAFKTALIKAKGNLPLVKAALEKSKEGACSKMDEEMKKKAKKKEAMSGEVDETADESMKKVPMKKSIQWEDPNKLLHVSTRRGQNAHYTVEEGLIKSEIEAVAKRAESTFLYDHEEKVEKSNKYGSGSNEILAKGEDMSECQALEKGQKIQPKGAYTVESFDIMTIAAEMGMSPDEAAEVMGLKKGEMEEYPAGEEKMKLEKKDKEDKKEKKMDKADEKKKPVKKNKTASMGVRG